MVEFAGRKTHRQTSGIIGALVAGFVAGAIVKHPEKHLPDFVVDAFRSAAAAYSQLVGPVRTRAECQALAQNSANSGSACRFEK